MSKFQRHFFVCQNDRPQGGKPSCASRGSREVLAALEEELMRRQDLWGEVAVTPCGCLGPCFDGPMVVVYPEGIWYAGVTPGDAQALLDGGAAAQRFVYKWPD
jgi:(2Fe-2S) ferredoxin